MLRREWIFLHSQNGGGCIDNYSRFELLRNRAHHAALLAVDCDEIQPRVDPDE